MEGNVNFLSLIRGLSSITDNGIKTSEVDNNSKLDQSYTSVFDKVMKDGAVKLSDFDKLATAKGIDQETIDQLISVADLFDEASYKNELGEDLEDGEKYISAGDLGMFITLTELWDSIPEEDREGMNAEDLGIEFFTNSDITSLILQNAKDATIEGTSDNGEKFTNIAKTISGLQGDINDLEYRDMIDIGKQAISSLVTDYTKQASEVKIADSEKVNIEKIKEDFSSSTMPEELESRVGVDENGQYYIISDNYKVVDGHANQFGVTAGIIKALYNIDSGSEEIYAVMDYIYNLNQNPDGTNAIFHEKNGGSFKHGEPMKIPTQEEVNALLLSRNIKTKETNNSKKDFVSNYTGKTEETNKGDGASPAINTNGYVPTAALREETPASNTQPNVTLEFTYGELGYGKDDDGKCYTIGSHGQLTEISERKYGYAHIDSIGREAILNEANQLNGFTSGGYQYVHTSDGSYYKILPGGAGREKVTVDDYLSAYNNRK